MQNDLKIDEISFDYSLSTVNLSKPVNTMPNQDTEEPNTDLNNLNTKTNLSSNLFNEEMNPLHFQVKKLQKLLVEEQDKYTRLQKKLHESENQRLELISANNKETFNLNTQYSKLRNELEKSEALRQNLEYELSLFKCNFNKEKHNFSDKEKMLEEVNKNLEDQLSALTKENLQVKSKLKETEMELSKEKNENHKLSTINKEQEDVICAIKDENNSSKLCTEKLKENFETCKEKEERLGKENEELLNRIQKLENELEKEKLQVEKHLSKIKDQDEIIKKNDNKKIEIELNLEKLMDQFKQTRKEALEDQTRNRDAKERFKIIESQLRMSNIELTKKLEEKTSIIQDLSKQLSVHEANFKEVKNELKQTKQKQAELDQNFNLTMQDIEKIQTLCTFNSNDSEYEEFKKFQTGHKKTQINPPQSVCPTLSYAVSALRGSVENFKSYFSHKLNEVNQIKAKYQKLTDEALANKKKYQKNEELKQKYEKDMETLRNERKALEDVIATQRNECETLKISLNHEFSINDNLKSQLNRVAKGSKELEDQKLLLLQSLYKRLIPISISNKQVHLPSDLRDEKYLEDFVGKLLTDLIDRLGLLNEKYTNLEKELIRNEEKLRHADKKHDEQILKLTKIIKEKENHYIKQKDSLVAYYEQLLNDVNSRVKLYIEGYMMTPLMHSQHSVELQANLSKSLEVECNNLKELLNKSQNCQRNLTTSCFILFGMLKTLIKQNTDLKEQRHIFEKIYSKWFKLINEKDANTSVKVNGTKKVENYVLAEAVDYSESSSIICGSSESLTDSVLSLKEKKRIKNINGLFRKVSILIMATHRLIYFNFQNKHNKLILINSNNKTHYQFIHLDEVTTNDTVSFSSVVTNLKSSNSNDEVKLKNLVNWFTLADNEYLNQFNEISNEFNKYLFNEDGNKSLEFETNLINVAKQTILKCFLLFDSKEKISKREASNCLVSKLKNGLNKICSKKSNIAIQYSFEKKLTTLNPQNEKKSVPIEKFESICEELEGALAREKQAQNLLYQQSCQMEDLSSKLAELSANELKSFKASSNESSRELIKQLNKKIHSLEKMKENYENSASSILLDKDLFLNYCQTIEDLIQKALIQHTDLKNLFLIIKKIANISFTSDSNLKLSPESLACKNLVNLFCAILLKLIEINFRDSKQILNNSLSTENPSNTDNEFDMSFQQLPTYKRSVFKQHS